MKTNIVGFTSYSIDRQGRVWSHLSTRYMKHQKDKDGYSVVGLRCDKGKKKARKVHRLLAQTFIPNPENKPCVNHKDGDKTNNSLSNLEWCTVKENVQHSYDMGLQIPLRGMSNTNAKLSDWDVRFIRYWHNKYKLSEIADLFDVSKSLIEKVVYRVGWKHI